MRHERGIECAQHRAVRRDQKQGRHPEREAQRKCQDRDAAVVGEQHRREHLQPALPRRIVERSAQRLRARLHVASGGEAGIDHRPEPFGIGGHQKIACQCACKEQGRDHQQLGHDPAHGLRQSETDELFELRAHRLARRIEDEIGAGAESLEIGDQRRVERGFARDRQRRQRRAIQPRQLVQIVVGQAAGRSLFDAVEQRLQPRPVRLALGAKMADGEQRAGVGHARSRKLR